MNIFFLHSRPQLCAIYSMDIHVGKMINECCLMLSIAHYVLDGKEACKYRVLWPDNPKYHNWTATKWVRTNQKTYQWTIDYLKALCQEYEYRTGKTHMSSRFINALRALPDRIEKNRHSFLPQMYPAVGKNFSKKYWVPTLKEDGTQLTYEMPFGSGNIYSDWDTVATYRNYYIYEKSKLKSAGWTKRQPPLWYLNGLKEAGHV